MGALVWAGLSAIAYGASDFVGGLRSRSVHFVWVTLFAQLVIALGVGGYALTGLGRLTPAALGWGALAGAGSVFGTLMLMRGFSRGAMHVAAPLSAVFGAAVPVAVGLALGERPSALALAGIVAALPAVWLVASAPAEPGASDHPQARHGSEGARDGVLAGLGFALFFIALAQPDAAAGHWPLIALEVVCVLLLSAVALVVRPAGRLTDARHAWPMGVLAVGGTVGYALASDSGLLSLVAVVTSLYPAFTVALAMVILHERPSKTQLAGLALAALAVVLIAAGGH